MNHSVNFKDPSTGAHTNNIEASWRAAKAITTSAGRKKVRLSLGCLRLSLVLGIGLGLVLDLDLVLG